MLVQQRTQDACKRVGRDPKGVRLVAVTKKVPVDVLQQAAGFGLTTFGESRVQEALPKLIALGAIIEWHLVGHLQTNKVREVVGRFALIHSVDNLRLARAVSAEAEARGLTQRILLEVNVAVESQKFGFTPTELEVALGEVRAMPGVAVEGLMTMAPLNPEPEAARPVFHHLARLARGFQLTELSMGMSQDFEVAVEEGATILRIGSAIFGPK